MQGSATACGWSARRSHSASRAGCATAATARSRSWPAARRRRVADADRALLEGAAARQGRVDRHRGGERARPRLPPPAGEFFAAGDGVGGFFPSSRAVRRRGGWPSEARSGGQPGTADKKKPPPCRPRRRPKLGRDNSKPHAHRSVRFRPSAGADRASAGEPARCGAAAGRAAGRAATGRPHRARPAGRCCAPATCSFSTTPRSSRRSCRAGASAQARAEDRGDADRAASTARAGGRSSSRRRKLARRRHHPLRQRRPGVLARPARRHASRRRARRAR